LSRDTRKDSLNESILSSASVLSNKTEKVRKARNEKWSDDNKLICESVATRQLAKGKSELLFKYKSCSICLCDFIQEEKVKVIPRCGHTFHEDCLENWLHKRFRCPNCNTDIRAEDAIQI
jgi:hypothetical protein